ncbi:MAG: S8 family serine peptidase [Planctomycetaceae bacterium]|nr:S8 family serine peptidase [Planctomycetaceae bacterium]
MSFLPRVAWLILPALLAPAARAQFELATSGDGSVIRWESGGPTVHSTRHEVRDLRAVRVTPGGAAIATWTETGAAGAQDWYAISLDGKAVQAVKPTSYELLLRRARFDPAQGAPDFSNSPLGAGQGGVQIVQYRTQPLVEYSDAIVALGGEVFDFVESHAHLVRMDAKTSAAVAALPFVRAVTSYHPEFRIDTDLLAELRAGRIEGARRYNVQVFRRGLAEQNVVAQRVVELGGSVDLLVPEGFRMEVTLPPAALGAIAGLDVVRFLDPWGAPEEDMDIVRQFGGANHVESVAGLTGQGVRVEVLDGGCDVGHPDFNAPISHGSVPSGSHGTCTAGIVAGTGAANAAARGMLPSAQLIVGYYSSFSGGSRYAHTAELVNPALNYKAVLQSNSWGSSLTTSYNSISAEMDDIIALNDFTILQSQSNANTQSSRPQAWAKNIISIGGINHEGTLTYADDNWGGASIGPAADQRMKPDLAYFYDGVNCPDVRGSGGYANGDYYSNFGGTSAATPISSGHFGIFFQMWHLGLFGNPAGSGTVFESRPHFTLAKAAMINTATSWSFSGSSANLSRAKQGFGHPDVRSLYERASKTFYVDQTDPVTNLGSVAYDLNVGAGEPALRVTLVYRDNQGTVSSTQHRKNDLTLVVTSPSGTVYYGNNGLTNGLWSTSGGAANTKDTVENVFVQSPAAGTWHVEVRGDNVNTHPVTGAPTNVTDFALWATGVTAGPVCPAPVTYCTAKMTSTFTVPQIGSSGSPRVSSNDFVLTLDNALPNRNALAFYGSLSHSGPFHNGLLCAKAPVTRSPVLQTNSSSHAEYAIPVTPAMVGTTRYYQWWFRDSQDTFGDGLSNGLQVTFCD